MYTNIQHGGQYDAVSSESFVYILSADRRVKPFLLTFFCIRSAGLKTGLSNKVPTLSGYHEFVMQERTFKFIL